MRTRHSRRPQLIFTCEHASNKIPPALKPLFQTKSRVLLTHRAWDKGALSLARTLAKETRSPLIEGRFSRLVVDLNRSADHRNALSEFTRKLTRDQQQALIRKIHRPFRQRALDQVKSAHNKGLFVYHLSVHTFVPTLDGKTRNCEVGILYDPHRPTEVRFAREIKMALERAFPQIRIRMNYPYRGTSDGHTAQLRKSHSDDHYAGVELEINQAWTEGFRPNIQKKIATAIHVALKSLHKSD